MNVWRWLLVASLLLGAGAVSPLAAAARLKDIAKVDVSGDLQLVGYGLVVGLDGTGDSRMTEFTNQSVVNMLRRLGITISESRLRVKNVAAVMATARLGSHHRVGSNIDVSISSLGDAKSLEGGTLLLTPLATPDGVVYASAQGPVSVGGFSVGGAGSDRQRQNYVLAGRVPGGGIVEREYEVMTSEERITIALYSPDYTTAGRVATAINQKLGADRAQALDAATIVVQLAEAGAGGGSSPAQRVSLVSRIEAVEVEPDIAARVVVNEKTGTIVAGEHVTIASVAIAHENLSVQIEGTPYVSQPEAFSRGETVLFEESDVSVQTAGSGLMSLQESANVGDLARALNALGVKPRDLIAIFQALKEAGALRAELRII